jgi:hypothetical protein
MTGAAGAGVPIRGVIVMTVVTGPGPAGIAGVLTSPDAFGLLMHPLTRHIPITRTIKIVNRCHFLNARTPLRPVSLSIPIYLPNDACLPFVDNNCRPQLCSGEIREREV